MATKKIRWTNELLDKQSYNSLKALPTNELLRAVNRFYSGMSKRVETMEKMDKEGYFVPYLYDRYGNKKNIQFKSADFFSSRGELIAEILRMKKFNTMKSTSAEGIKQIYKENRQRVRELYKVAGYSVKDINTIMKRLTPKDITNIWKAFRRTQETHQTFGSQQRLDEIIKLYEQDINNIKGNEFDVGDFVNKLFKEGIYEQSPEEIKAEIEKLKAEQEQNNPTNISSIEVPYN